MRTLANLLAIVLVPAAIGCGGGDDGSGPGGGDVLTSIEVTPASSSLYTLAPGNTVQLAVVARNQDDEIMDGVEISYSSPNAAVAAVSNTGLVTAAGAGTVEVQVSVTFDGVTLHEGANVTVQVASAGASVTAPEFDYLPDVVHVSAGGSVTWTFASVTHDVDFTTAGAPADIPEFDSGSEARLFPASGVYEYDCTRHPSMHGEVWVH